MSAWPGLSSRSTRVSKTFRIPSVRRDTVREHRARRCSSRARFEQLQVLDDVSFELRDGRDARHHGPQRLRQEHAAQDPLRHLSRRTPGGSRCTRAASRRFSSSASAGIPELDAIDNVCLIGSGHGAVAAREIRARMDEILAFAELERFANLKLKHYSSGMASRLAYAVAFEAVRDVLVLDEIFAVGDAGSRRSARSGIGSCARRAHGVARESRTEANREHVLRPRAAARRRPHRLQRESTQTSQPAYLPNLTDPAA